MWEVVADLIFLQLLDMLPRPVRIGCLSAMGLFLVVALALIFFK